MGAFDGGDGPITSQTCYPLHHATPQSVHANQLSLTRDVKCYTNNLHLHWNYNCVWIVFRWTTYTCTCSYWQKYSQIKLSWVAFIVLEHAFDQEHVSYCDRKNFFEIHIMFCHFR